MYDVIVIGAGHAGCEAALAAARMGCSTLLVSMDLERVAFMPCNPSIGGPAKGHLVREIDALGGEMGRAADQSFIQIRMLNTGKGPAVQAPRAQCDKRAYGSWMKSALEKQPGLTLEQALVEGIERVGEGGGPRGGLRVTPHLVVRTRPGQAWEGRTVVLTAGTSLGGRIMVGDTACEGGRLGEQAAARLSGSLKGLGLRLGRLRTSTPPRIDARTIDFSLTALQSGSASPLYFSFASDGAGTPQFLSAPACQAYPPGPPAAWRPQLPCYLAATNSRTHEIIRANLHRAPLFTGAVTGASPRSCPSIEDKIIRFPRKESHQLFLEPEGWESTEVYVQGAYTSLPPDVQLEMLRSIPALERAEIVRAGYAVGYDFVPPSQTGASLESKVVPGMFLAGQVNGTTGYEEAAGQGLMAGINAASLVQGRPSLVLRRDQAYLGVMIDDLVTRDLTEPYRLFTSRAEFRLLLRQDNADLRLTRIGCQAGLVDRGRHAAVEAKREAIAAEIERLGRTHFVPPGERRGTSGAAFLRRPETTYGTVLSLGIGAGGLGREARDQVEIEVKYAGYIDMQAKEVDRVRRLEELRVPPDIDYAALTGLRFEAGQKLNKFRPATLGQASRVDGVTPADVAVLMVHMEKARKR